MRLLLAAAALCASDAAKAPGSAQYAALRPALDEIASLRAHVDGGACVPGLGAKAEAICAGVPLLKLPQPLTNIVSPVNTFPSTR